jgi:ABC-type transport system involved in cytochrome bd biosynthesis fused ATPase/permease subunit
MPTQEVIYSKSALEVFKKKKKKTVVLVTHQMEFLHEADMIVVVIISCKNF